MSSQVESSATAPEGSGEPRDGRQPTREGAISHTSEDRADAATESWHALPAQDALTLLRTSSEGLSQEEAAARLARYGSNSLPPIPGVSAITLLLDQLRSVVVLLLVGAVVVAVVTQQLLDAAAIAAVLLINTFLGWGIELRARRSMESLLRTVPLSARVVRGGEPLSIDATQLVPGDLLLLEPGDAVPADARLVVAAELRTNDASLTGESTPVSKSADWVGSADTPLPARRNCVYTGTTVVSGTARAVVFATAAATEVGQIGEMVGAVRNTRTPLERRLDALGRRFVWFTLAVTALVLASGMLQGVPLSIMLKASIALAIAAVPEGLPAVATIALAVGLRRMAARNAIIRRLHAVEALGSTTVVCTDKTGTLTSNQMMVTSLRFVDGGCDITGHGYGTEGEFNCDGHDGGEAVASQLGAAAHIATWTSKATLRLVNGQWTADGDPTDAALLAMARKAPSSSAAQEPVVSGELPFSSERKLSAVFTRNEGSIRALVKGAPARIAERCARALTRDGEVALDATMRSALEASNDALAERGLRVIALAHGTVRGIAEADLNELTFIALAGMIDTPAEGVHDTIRLFRDAGIRTVMLTGDQRGTAIAIARQLGMTAAADAAVDGAELDQLDADALLQRAPHIAVCSRASAANKFALVEALRQRGEVVAMLGDGVNDAAALKRADIGVAMGVRGTDVAKEIADVVLKDDRFSTIGVAVEEGRVIYDNIRKFIFYLFSCNLAEVLVLFVASASGLGLPLVPLQILWLNLVTDTFPALALAFEPAEPDVMKRPPRKPDAAIMSWAFMRATAFYAALIAAVTLIAFILALQGDAASRATTVAFMTLALAQLLHLGNARSITAVVSPRRIIANPYALAALGGVAALQLTAVYYQPVARLLYTQPLTVSDWMLILPLATIPAVIGQLLRSRSSSSPKTTR